MTRKVSSIFIAVALFVGEARAQDKEQAPVITLFGPDRSVTPGGITLLQFAGLPATDLGFQARDGEPWPLEVKGVSMIFHAPGSIFQRGVEQRVPIGAVLSGPDCGRNFEGRLAAPFQACNRTSFLVRMPLDVVPNWEFDWRNVIRLEGDGWRSLEFHLTASASIVKVLSFSCSLYSEFTGSINCRFPNVVDENGRWLLTGKPGQKLSLRATGLGALRDGATDPKGEPAVEPAPTRARYRLAFEFRKATALRPVYHRILLDLLPSIADLPTWRIVEPTYVGLDPGQVGVYRIDFEAPTPPPDAPPCGDTGNVSVTLFGEFYGTAYTDSFPLCIEPSR